MAACTGLWDSTVEFSPDWLSRDLTGAELGRETECLGLQESELMQCLREECCHSGEIQLECCIDFWISFKTGEEQLGRVQRGAVRDAEFKFGLENLKSVGKLEKL